MIRPQVEETVEALRRAVGAAGLGPDQLTAVLLVGGSSRIPLVAQLVSEQLGRPVAVDADPKNAIAKGAALALSPKPSVTWPGAVGPAMAAAGGAAAGGPPEPGRSGRGEAGRQPGSGAPGGPGPAAGAAAMAAGWLAAAPPSRPPHPGSRRPDGAPGIDADQAGPHRSPVIPRQSAVPPTPPPRPPAGPVHESAGRCTPGWFGGPPPNSPGRRATAAREPGRSRLGPGAPVLGPGRRLRPGSAGTTGSQPAARSGSTSGRPAWPRSR